MRFSRPLWTSVIVVMICFAGTPTPVMASEPTPPLVLTTPKPEPASQQDDRNWRIIIGASYALPKLKEANQDVHAVEAQVRQIAPSVRTFQDWDDIVKGTVGIGVSYRLKVYGVTVWPELFFAYGVGEIKTEENGLPTVFGVPMDYRFKQTYDFKQLSFGFFPEVLNAYGFSVQIGGYGTANYLIARTYLDTSIAAIATEQHVRGHFGEFAMGGAVQARLSYAPPFLKNVPVLDRLELMLAARYDWLKFKADTKITDTQLSPLGAVTTETRQPSVSDMTGWSFFGGLKVAF